VVRIGHRRGIERGEVGLDRGVEGIQHAVGAPGLGDALPVVLVEGVAHAVQHGLEQVGQAQRLA
jgi:hypothetical protein